MNPLQSILAEDHREWRLACNTMQPPKPVSRDFQVPLRPRFSPSPRPHSPLEVLFPVTETLSVLLGPAIICGWALLYCIVQSTSLITTLGGAPEKCPYSRSVVIPEVSLYVLQLHGTLLWAGKLCRYSRIVVISRVVISEVDCILPWS